MESAEGLGLIGSQADHGVGPQLDLTVFGHRNGGRLGAIPVGADCLLGCVAMTGMTPSPRSRRLRSRLIAVIVVGLALVSWLVFSGTLGVRSSVRILVAEPRPQAQLWLAVAACDVAPQLASLVQTEDEVPVEVTVWRRFRTHANDCSDSITIDLSQTLGERSVIDASTGQLVPQR